MWWWIWTLAAAGPQTVHLPCAAPEGPRTFEARLSNDAGTTVAARATVTVEKGEATGTLTDVRAWAHSNGTSTTRPGPYTWRWAVHLAPGEAITAKPNVRGALKADLQSGMGEGAYSLDPFEARFGEVALPFGLAEIVTAAELGCGEIPTAFTTTPATIPNPWGGPPIPGTATLSAKREDGEIHLSRVIHADADAWQKATPPRPESDGPSRDHHGDVSWSVGYSDVVIARFAPKTGALLGISASREAHGGAFGDAWNVQVQATKP